MAEISLTPDFEEAALAQFDSLRNQDLLFYEVPTKETVEGPTGFKLHFLTSSAMTRKPILPPNAPERRGLGGPFIDPDPRFVVPADLGPDHVLEFSMHCMYRPHFVLHTRLFAPQTDDLDLGDLRAALAVARAVGKGGGRQAVIYNCGFEAGASQGHKHLQVFELGDVEVWPDWVVMGDGEKVVDDVPGVGWRHFVMGVREGAGAEEVLGVYGRLLGEVRRVTEREGGVGAYNFVWTERWVCLVPRRRGGRDGVGTNAIGMLGVIWAGNQDDMDGWTRFGMEGHLVYMGYPREEY